jgi:hypothetical protein
MGYNNIYIVILSLFTSSKMQSYPQGNILDHVLLCFYIATSKIKLVFNNGSFNIYRDFVVNYHAF